MLHTNRAIVCVIFSSHDYPAPQNIRTRLRKKRLIILAIIDHNLGYYLIQF